MSYTTVKAVWIGERVEDLHEFRNARGSAPVVWNEMAKRYLGLRDHQYLFCCDNIWPLYRRSDVAAHHRNVLLMTYDDAIVTKANYKQAAADIRAFLVDFPPQQHFVNHWPHIASIFDSEPDCPAIGFHMTSVSEDPFAPVFDPQTNEYQQPQWSKYWDVYDECKQSEVKAA